MSENSAMKTSGEGEYLSCKICRRKFANEKLPPCELSICPRCCTACLDGGCDDYC